MPGVTAAGAAQKLPFAVAAGARASESKATPTREVTTTFVRFVTPEYLQTMGVKLRDGRMFTDADRRRLGPNADGVVVVNEALVKKYFAGDEPHRAPHRDRIRRLVGTVIGVVQRRRRGRPDGCGRDPRGTCCTRRLPFVASGEALVFRTTGRDPEAALDEAREVVRRTRRRSVAFERVTTMQRVAATGRRTGASGHDAARDPHVARARARRRGRVRRDLALRESAQPRLGRAASRSG